MVMLPNLSDITGPYFVDSLASDSWGLEPSWKRLPIIGYWYGPGGSFDDIRARIMENVQTMEKIMITTVKTSIEIDVFFFLFFEYKLQISFTD